MAIGITVALAVIGTIVLLKLVDLVIGVRISIEDEIEGLDLSQHGEEGYNLDLDVTSVGATARISHSAIHATERVLSEISG
jgi:Amt family ammonium transporter